MGLGFLGRGHERHAVEVGLVHVIGGIVGGAFVGGLIGWIGSFFPIAPLHRWLIAVAAALALIVSLTKPQRTLGLGRQVPRDWRGKVSAAPRYLLWGLLLGSGVATLIPYSAFLLLIASQFSSGPRLACLSGALFGGVRTMPALIPLVKVEYRVRPVHVLELLPALRPTARRVNTAVIATLGVILAVTIEH